MISKKIASVITSVMVFCCIVAVSYTHLDVYKRQTWWSDDCIPIYSRETKAERTTKERN